MRRLIFRPEILMSVVWVGFVALYLVVPIEYLHAPKFGAWSLMVGGVLAFCFGSTTVTLPAPIPTQRVVDVDHLNATIALCALAGLFGAALIAIDKVFFSGQDWSIGITALRDRRAVEVVEGVPITRSVLLYIGYLTFSFSCASICLFLLKGENVNRSAGRLAQTSIFAMVVYAAVYGGRMPILLVIILAVASGMVRKLMGCSLLPRGWYLWPKMLVVALAFLAYTNAIWARRRENDHLFDYDSFLRHAAERWQLKPSAWLDHTVESGKLSIQTAMDLISSAMYLTHSPTTIQRAVEHQGELSTYFGLYQIGILSPLFDVFAPGLKLPETMRAELAKAGLYGWFPNAWGAWLLDCGPVLGMIAIVCWGFLSGTAYAAVARSGSLAAQLMLVFAYAAILLSPLNGPFGVANSFLILCSFALVAFWLALLEKRASNEGASGLTAEAAYRR